jgi:gliding motility-associated-like protein
VLYEGTGVIEVFVFDKQICTGWNEGRAMIGLQNYARDQAIMAPGRKASDAPWGAPNMNESWRFVPSSGPTLFKRVELYDMSGNLVATGDTTSINNVNLGVTFNNVCPPAGAGSVIKYMVKSVYAQFDNPAAEVFGIDTIVVNRNAGFNVSVLKTDALCNGASNGGITVTPTSGTAPYLYAIDGGTYQSTNTFTVAAGSHIVSVKDASNCTKDTTIVVGQPIALAATLSTTPAICFGSANGTFTIAASNGTAPYTYSIDGGANYQSTGTFTVAAGQYTIRIKDASNCTKDTTVLVTQPLALSATLSTTPATCFGAANGTVTITATNGTAPYLYSNDGGANYQSAGTFTFAAGPHTIRIKDANNCTKDTVVTVSQPAVLSGTVTTSNASCSASPNGQINVTAAGGTAPYTYSSNGTSFQNTSSFTVAQGTFTVTIKDANNCTVPVQAVVGFTFDLTLSGRSDTSICENASVRLFTSTNATSFSWSPSTNLDNASTLSPLATPTANVSYVVTASTGTCTLKDTVKITLVPSPLVSAGGDITISKGADATLAGSVTNASSFIWSPATYLNNVNVLNPISVMPQETITYRLTASNSLGCTKYDEVKVIVTPYCIKVKNAFTPNGDGLNDTWSVYDQFTCLKNVKVAVYNRYGTLVYESRNYRNDWKGTYGGKNLPDATYYYVIDFQLAVGRVQQVKGDLTILR